MLNSLITSQTRIKLLLKFFMNSSTKAHLRGLESEFGESTNGIRVELNRLEQAGLLLSLRDGNRKFYSANTRHPLFMDIHNLILKEKGIDTIIENVVNRLGNLTRIYLAGDLAHGKNSDIIELIIIGDDVDESYLNKKIVQCEKVTGRNISSRLISRKEARQSLYPADPDDLLVLWTSD